MAPKQWMFDPNSGGRKIPSTVQVEVEKRIRAIAEKEFAGKYTRLKIRFRNQFCHIDAYSEPVLTEAWPPANWPETREDANCGHSYETTSWESTSAVNMQLGLLSQISVPPKQN